MPAKTIVAPTSRLASFLAQAVVLALSLFVIALIVRVGLLLFAVNL